MTESELSQYLTGWVFLTPIALYVAYAVIFTVLFWRKP